MEPSTQKLDYLNSHESAEPLSILEEKLRRSFVFPTLPQATPVLNGELVLDEPEVEFLPLPVAEMSEDDVKTLDKARRSGAYIYLYSVEEFAETIKSGLYDVWKAHGIEGCQCIILTSWEHYGSARILLIHYLAGWKCKPHIPRLRKAMLRLCREGGGMKIIYTAPKDHYAKFVGGRRLASVYELVEE